VIALTQDVISNGGYALEDNLKDIFFQKGLASKEVILGIYPEPNQIIKHDDYLNYPEWNASQELIDHTEAVHATEPSPRASSASTSVTVRMSDS